MKFGWGGELAAKIRATETIAIKKKTGAEKKSLLMSKNISFRR